MIEKFTVIWTHKAEQSFLNTLSFIIENWSEKEALKFNNKVQKLTQLLASNKHLCPKSNSDNSRRCVISKQNSLTYKIENNNIYIMLVIDNRTNHKY